MISTTCYDRSRPRATVDCGVRSGVAGQDQFPTVSGWEVDVEHLDASKLVEHGPRRETGRQRPELGAQRDV